jgi:TPR repeat protein
MSRAAISLHRQRSAQDLQQLLAWYKVRDTLFGHNGVLQNVTKALQLASVSQHPDAVWLTKLFATRSVGTKEEAREVFLQCDENDAKALCFAGVLGDADDELRHAADLGDALAQAKVASAWNSRGEECVDLAEKAAAQGERDGFFWLGCCYRWGHGCERDEARTKENYLIAAELGDVAAMVRLGELLDKDDPLRFVWLGRAAANGRYAQLLSETGDQIRNFNCGTGHAMAIFAVGRALNSHIDEEKQEIFGDSWKFVAANQAVNFFRFQLQSYRKAVDSWTVVGLRNIVVKDIRKMIGKMIWDAREEAEYLIQGKRE